MPQTYLKFNGKNDRRSPRNEGRMEDPVIRENFVSRDGKLSTVGGTKLAITTDLEHRPTWVGRYYSFEVGTQSPISFAYTADGKLWRLNDNLRTGVVVKTLLNAGAYPNHHSFKSGEQNLMYLVDGLNLYKYDGNGDFTFIKVDVLDSNDDPVEPIDVIEHRDRLCLISESFLFISKNLDPDNFGDATDSLQIVVGSGKGKNIALAKIEETLYIFNTEGIFQLFGDTISAVAQTFAIRLVDPKRCVAGRTVVLVENQLNFLGDDLEMWSFNGQSPKLLSRQEKLKDLISPYRNQLDKAVATYEKNFYKLSFVEKGQTENNREAWWDAFEDKIDFIVDRNVAYYLEIDPSKEIDFFWFASSTENKILYADETSQFNGSNITMKLRTRDFVPKKGWNVRFNSFHVFLEPTGNRDIQFAYYVDGLLSPVSGSDPTWDQNIRGETKGLGAISIGNQGSSTYRVQPKIAYSKGESISFEIISSTKNAKLELLGIMVDYTLVEQKRLFNTGR